MVDQVQAIIASCVEHLREGGQWIGLLTRQTDPHHALRGVGPGELQRAPQSLEGAAPRVVQQHLAFDAITLLTDDQSPQHALEWHLEPAQSFAVSRGGKGDLGIPRPLRRFVLAELEGDTLEVGRGLQALAHQRVVVGELFETAAKLVDRDGNVDAIGLPDLLQGAPTDRALDVDMQVRLRQTSQVAHHYRAERPG